jgi:DNA (cytosine-5)-methyltransferase 1
MRLVERSHTPWVLLENVPFMLQLKRGQAMHFIASAFENMGYKWAYRIVDARSFGLPQRRRRVYFLASRVGDPRSILFADDAGPVDTISPIKVACGFYWTEGVRGLGWAIDSVPTLKGGSGLGIPSSPAILTPDGDVVTLDIRDAERLQGFPADWTKPAEAVMKRGHRWKLVGNAVSVPAAHWIGRRMANPGVPLDLPTAPLPGHLPWPTAAWNVGTGRESVEATEWPIRSKARSLEDFLRYPKTPLSAKATAGFLKRTERARLRFPEGFIVALSAHLDRMSSQPSEAGSRRMAPARGAAELVYGRSRYTGTISDAR